MQISSLQITGYLLLELITLEYVYRNSTIWRSKELFRYLVVLIFVHLNAGYLKAKIPKPDLLYLCLFTSMFNPALVFELLNAA